jgi:outer membrane protein assembly factor BamB
MTTITAHAQVHKPAPDQTTIQPSDISIEPMKTHRPAKIARLAHSPADAWRSTEDKPAALRTSSLMHREMLFELVADDAHSSNRFGVSTAISGNLAVVGADMADFTGDTYVHDAGAAYVFNLTTGEQMHKLVSDMPETGSWFGLEADICGDRIIVGAHQNSSFYTGAGVAYIFDATTGERMFQLIPDHLNPEDSFGCAVAINDAYAIVGALGDDSIRNNNGAVYVFDAATGAFIHKLVVSNDPNSTSFGRSIDLDGDMAIVSSYDSASELGTAHIVDIATGQFLHSLCASDGAEDDRFGFSVSISGDRAIVGAPTRYGAGSAYIFDATTGAQLFKCVKPDPGPPYRFGESVSIDGGTAIIGASETSFTYDSCGAAYVFDVLTGHALCKLKDPADKYDFRFGAAVAIQADRAVVGAFYGSHANEYIGAAYVYDNLFHDCNDNGVPDSQDIANGTSTDDNANDIPDECENLDCPWDTIPIGGDDIVDMNDLTALLDHWGSCPAPCPYDFAPEGGDGTVGLGDLNALLSNWGPCP